MPLNGKSNPVSKPSWLKDTSTPASSTPTTTPGRAWARKTSDAPVKEEPKKEVNVKLQSREIKVPFKTERTIPTQSILKRPEVKIKQDLKEEQKTLPLLRETKTPSKSPVNSKTPSTTSSKSPTPSTKSTTTTASKSPSKTPDYDSDEDEESSYETDSSEEETDSDEEISDDEKPSYKPPSPGALKKHLVIKPLKKASPTPEKSEPERSQSPDYTFKKPELKKVITKQKSDAKERSASPEPKFVKPKLRKVPSSMKVKEPPAREKLPIVELKKAPTKTEPEQRPRKMSEQFPHKPSILRAESNKKSEWKIIKIPV